MTFSRLRKLPTGSKAPDPSGFECDVCGKYEISGSAFSEPLDPEKTALTSIQTAALTKTDHSWKRLLHVAIESIRFNQANYLTGPEPR